MSIFQYSTTPSANTSVDGVNIAEGMPPGNVNNGMRAMMSDTRKWQLDSGGFAVTGGTGNSYTMTASQDFTAYASGMRFTFRANRANTGNATINISGRGAVQLRKFSGGSSVTLDADDIATNEVIDVVYSASPPSFVMIAKAGVTENTVAMTGPGLIGKGTSGNGNSLRITFGDGILLLAGALTLRLGAGLSFVSGAVVAAVSRFSTQAEALAGTNNNSAMTPLRVSQAVSSQAAVKAWGNFHGGTLNKRAGVNFSSVTRSTDGRYTITFETPMPDTNYAVTAMCSNEGGNVAIIPAVYSTTQFAIQCKSFNANQDAAIVSFQVTR